MITLQPRHALQPAFAVLLSLAACQHFASTASSSVAPIAAISATRAASPPLQSGSFPTTWIHGADCVNDPSFQVHAYNEDTFILRQSKCDIYEAPFLFMLFGEDRVLLLDTGALPSAPVHATVMGVIDRWLARNNRESIPLTVAHTHGHFDHIAADAQFNSLPGVQFIGAGLGPATAFWGFQDYPNDIPSMDLGGRVIDIMGTPGHHPVSVTIYDRNTRLLLSGDIVYPGHLFVFSPAHWSIFQDSLERMIVFSCENPVQWVVGCHIEISNVPFGSFAYGTTVQPDEHPLEFHPRILGKILRAAEQQGNDPDCTIYDEFVLHPVYKCGITWNG